MTLRLYRLRARARDNFSYDHGFASAYCLCQEHFGTVLCRTDVHNINIRLRGPTAYIPGCCVKQYAAFSVFLYRHTATKEGPCYKQPQPLPPPSVHDHAIKVDAVAESYLNVGGICCLVL